MSHETQVIEVSVLYALPERHWLLRVRVPEGTTAGEAIERSGIRDLAPDVDLDDKRIGIFGRLCTPQTQLHAGDRVELYRPLQCDPKENRRQRADAEQKPPAAPATRRL